MQLSFMVRALLSPLLAYFILLQMLPRVTCQYLDVESVYRQLQLCHNLD
jgi:hypothetical protein